MKTKICRHCLREDIQVGQKKCHHCGGTIPVASVGNILLLFVLVIAGFVVAVMVLERIW